MSVGSAGRLLVLLATVNAGCAEEPALHERTAFELLLEVILPTHDRHRPDFKLTQVLEKTGRLLPKGSRGVGPEPSGEMRTIVEGVLHLACCDRDSELRGEMVKLLARLRPRMAVATLRRIALTDSNPYVRQAAIEALNRYDDSKLLELLIPLWRTETELLKPNASSFTSASYVLALALAAKGKHTAPFLRTLLVDPMPRVRYHALWSLCATTQVRPTDFVLTAARAIDAEWAVVVAECKAGYPRRSLRRRYSLLLDDQ